MVLSKLWLIILSLKQKIKQEPKTKLWFIIYIGLPVMPILIGGFLRLILSSWRLTTTTFSATELSVGIVLLCIFINQDLKNAEIKMLLSDKDKISEIKTTEFIFILWCFVFLGFYLSIIIFESVIQYHNAKTLEECLHQVQIFNFILAAVVISWSISVQKSYKLEANI